jgi:site-specific DNA-methyltransferase (adenine-specific)
MSTIEILNADALTLPLDTFAEFDALITDPPYSAHVHENATSVGVRVVDESGNEVPSMGVRARDLGFASLSGELRIKLGAASQFVRRWSCIFTDHEGTQAWRESSPAEYIRMVPWVRWSQPQLSGDRPCTGSEAVLVFHRQEIGARGGTHPIAKHWNGPGSLVAFGVDVDEDGSRAPRRAMRGQFKHPTEKPLDLMLDLVSWFSDPGEAVIDPCAGAGTTLLACRLLGRDGVGVELDPQWAATARARATGVLSDRDRTRATEWIESIVTEASRVPAPRAKDGSDVRTWERAQRRLADAKKVSEAI